MLFKKKKLIETHILANQEYINAIQFTQNAISKTNEIKEKIDILEYVISTVKIDLQTDLLAKVIYKGWDLMRISHPFPPYYYDEQGKELCIFKNRQDKIKINLATDCILVLPWDLKRYVPAALYFKQQQFKYHKDNHYSIYYEYIDLCYIHNGIHSSSAGVTYKKGNILADIYSTKDLFAHVYTDGVHWYNEHNNQQITKVWDFRTAVIYELCRMKFNLELID